MTMTCLLVCLPISPLTGDATIARVLAFATQKQGNVVGALLSSAGRARHSVTRIRRLVVVQVRLQVESFAHDSCEVCCRREHDIAVGCTESKPLCLLNSILALYLHTCNGICRYSR